MDLHVMHEIHTRAKEIQMNFDEILGFSKKFVHIFAMPIVPMRAIFEQ